MKFKRLQSTFVAQQANKRHSIIAQINKVQRLYTETLLAMYLKETTTETGTRKKIEHNLCVITYSLYRMYLCIISHHFSSGYRK